MDIKTLINCLKVLPASQAVLIRGDHGIGKSQIVHALAKMQKKRLIDVRASTMSEGDVVGYPNLDLIKTTGVASFALPSWYVRACNEGVVLFLDELNRGLIGVLNGMFQIILDRQLGSGPDGMPMSLHPDTQVIAAVNKGSEYTVNEMDPALLSRFWVQDLTPTHEDWISWAASDGDISSVIVDFIRQNPAHLRPTRLVEIDKIAPNQRSWVMFDRTLKHANIVLSDIEGTIPEIIYPVASGFVGFEAASAFNDYLKTFASLITANDVLNKWNAQLESRVKECSTEKVLAIIEKIKTHCLSNSWNSKQIKNMKKFFDLLTGEQKLQFYNLILSTQQEENIRLIHNEIKVEVTRMISSAREYSNRS